MTCAFNYNPFRRDGKLIHRKGPGIFILSAVCLKSPDLLSGHPIVCVYFIIAIGLNLDNDTGKSNRHKEDQPPE